MTFPERGRLLPYLPFFFFDKRTNRQKEGKAILVPCTCFLSLLGLVCWKLLGLGRITFFFFFCISWCCCAFVLCFAGDQSDCAVPQQDGGGVS